MSFALKRHIIIFKDYFERLQKQIQHKESSGSKRQALPLASRIVNQELKNFIGILRLGNE
jgi:hypothetical protein